MAVAFDDQTPAVSPASREALVRAVLAAPSTESEPPWIEWKGPVDSLRGWAPRIGVYLLGFANRPVEWARRHTGGWGYLLLGVEPGTAHGIAPADTADLVKWVGPYLGTRGPQWDPHFIEVDGVTALLIGVPPPRPGDPIYPARRSFHGPSGGKQFNIDDGEVVIRAGSETRRARSEELELLMARAAARGPHLSVSVINRSEPFTTIDTRDEHRKRWLASERGGLLAPIGADPPVMEELIGERVSEAMRSMNFGMETRSEDEYRSQVDEYIERAAETWDARLTQFAAKHRLAELRLQVRNETPHNFPAVELIVHIPGQVIAGWEGEWDWVERPRPPMAWGSQRPLSALSISPQLFRSPLLDSPPIFPAGPGHIDNSASARITFDEFDLRPEETYDLESVFLMISEEHAGSALEASWKLTSKSVSGIVSGTMSFAVERYTAVMQPTRRGGKDDADRAEPRE